MFAARGIAVSLSVFVLVYGALSIAVSCVWSTFWLRSRRHSPDWTANLLFSLRLFPLAAAALITAAFTVPSFLMLEPRGINESMSPFSLALGACGALLFIFGAGNAAIAVRRTSRAITGWMHRAQPVEAKASVPVLKIFSAVPAMTATGIIRPRILFSATAEFRLTAGELKSALNHELAHVCRRDNLKKLLVRFVPFPGMKALEAAWLEAIEMAADDAAVSTTSEALDLAAAVIKLSRLAPPESPLNLTTALVPGAAAQVQARVQRLIAWTEQRRISTRKVSFWYGLAAVAITIGMLGLTYAHLLAHMHTATEWLVH